MCGRRTARGARRSGGALPAARRAAIRDRGLMARVHLESLPAVRAPRAAAPEAA